MKTFFQAFVGAVVLGAVVAYFFGPIWFWVIVFLGIIGGIQSARDEKKSAGGFDGSPHIVTEPTPKRRSTSTEKSKIAAEKNISVDQSSSMESKDASNRGFSNSGESWSRKGEPSFIAEVSEQMPNYQSEGEKAPNSGQSSKVVDEVSQGIEKGMRADKENLGAIVMSERGFQSTKEKNAAVNPFSHPIASLVQSLFGIKWSFPFLPQVIELVVLFVALVLTALLYLTIGIASQIERTLLALMRSSGKGASEASVIERSAYAIAGGIYLIVWLPFWLALLPFNILGWLWQTFGYAGVIVLLLILVAVAGFVYFDVDLRRVFEVIGYDGVAN